MPKNINNTIQQDNTRVVPKPRLMLPEERRQQKIKKDEEVKTKRQQEAQQRQARLNSERQIVRQALQQKHDREQKAIEVIQSGKQHMPMDQTTQVSNNPSYKSTFQKTPEQEYVQQAVPYKGSWVEGAVAGAITLPLTAPLAGATIVKTINTSFGRQLVSDLIANWALNKGYEAATDRNLARDINYISGLDPDNAFGSFATFGVSGPTKNLLSKAAFEGFVRTPQAKRLVEVGLRTQSDVTDYSQVLNHFKYNLKNPAGRSYLLQVGKYILTGTPKYANSLNRTFKYTGLMGLPNFTGNDVVDAYVFGRTIDPRLATYEGKGTNFGVHTNYINTYYKNKKKDIPIYITDLPASVPKYEVRLKSDRLLTPIQSTSGSDGALIAVDGQNLIDTGGHIISKSGNLEQHQDIWKFNTDYSNKYHVNTDQSLRGSLNRFGLKLVDRVSTPIIFRTPIFENVPNAKLVSDLDDQMLYSIKPIDFEKIKEFIESTPLLKNKP